MTHEEAKEIVNRIKGYMCDGECWSESEFMAMEMAIQALSQEPQCTEHPCLGTLCRYYKEPCTDAVSRDMALEKMADYVASGYADSAEDFEEYSRIICQLPSVTQKSGKWIPVSEDLPKKSDRYLAYIVNEHDDKLQYIMTCDYSADGYWNWFPDDESASDNVVAWMPLPKPYKTESENEI